MTITEIREWVADHNEEALLADGFEDAIIGMGERCTQEPVVIYDADKCLEILQERDSMSEEDATDYFYFNVLGAWLGKNTPIFVWRINRLPCQSPSEPDSVSQTVRSEQ
jgi:hypothetical protein